MDYLVSGLEMAALDRRAIAELNLPGRVLMETAGRAVAAACAARLPAQGRVVVLCGTGNNGGDGFVVANTLASRGHRVDVFIFGERGRIKDDAKAALTTLERTGGVEVVEAIDAKRQLQFVTSLKQADIAVDALLGTGAHADVHGPVGDAIDILNRAVLTVISVDVPSGIDADTGVVLGRAVSASATVTFGFAKRGHYLYPGAEHRGELQVVDIGVPHRFAEESAVVGRRIAHEDGPTLLPARRGAVHKGTFGHVVVVAGSPSTPGAALLALRGALRSGAGLVSWATSEEVLTRAPSLPPEVMLRLRNDDAADAWAGRIVEGATALVVGPGLSTGPHASELLAALLKRCRAPICLDADALNILGADPTLWEALAAPLVVTPHPKEMARLTQADVGQVQRDRFAAAMQLAMGRGCAVLLKGAGTVVAEPDGTVAVVDAGDAALATGGTGDVLAGLVGGLLAQGLEPGTAARAAALWHGAAGEVAAAQHGRAATTASDVVDALGTVLLRWRR